MGAFDDAPLVEAGDAATWRSWLEANHKHSTGAWLVTWRLGSGRPVLPYEAAVEEALCFGWVDSRGGRLDEHRTKLYFAPRNPRSGWAGPNKERVARLLAEGRMAPAGIAAIERAKANGSWTLLDAVERLEIPDDLAAALDSRPGARAAFEAFPRSVRRASLEWLVQARRPETRARRVAELAAGAERNERVGPAAPRS